VAAFEVRAASLCSLATCGLRRGKTRAWVNPKLESDCIPGAVERNVSLIWWVAGARSKSILGANDFDGDTAERFGYVNRALPDAELEGFVDTLARRIASFDRRAVAAAKKSRQPSLTAIRRPAPRRTQFLPNRVDVERSAAANRGSVEARSK